MKPRKKRQSIRSIESRNQLAEQHYGMVRTIAKKLVWLHHGNFEDAFQAGCIGLLRAAELFDESRGIQFSTYAYHHITAQIRTMAKTLSTIHVPDRRQLPGKIVRIDDKIEQRLVSANQGKDFLLLDRVQAALKKIMPKRAAVLTAHLNGQTYQQIAQAHHCSRERVRQIKDQAIRDLRLLLRTIN